MKPSPCRYCNDRHEGCHTTCEIGKKWDKEHKEEMEIVAEKRLHESRLHKIKMEGIKKTHKGRYT